jgi:hypothetical protein
VLSQPDACAPHRWYPGDSDGIRTPAAPSKRYHAACDKLL